MCSGSRDAVLLLALVQLGQGFADEVGVDGAVDDRVGDVDALRPQLARHALGQGTQGELGAGERGEMRAAAQRGGGASEDDRSALPRQHHPRRLAAGEEAAEGGHLPDLAIDPFGGFGDREPDVGADVEDHRLQRTDLTLDAGEEVDHLLLLACVAAAGQGLAALVADGLHQRLQLLRVAPGDARHVALAGELPGDGATGGVAGAHYQNRFALGHCRGLSC